MLFNHAVGLRPGWQRRARGAAWRLAIHVFLRRRLRLLRRAGFVSVCLPWEKAPWRSAGPGRIRQDTLCGPRWQTRSRGPSAGHPRCRCRGPGAGAATWPSWATRSFGPSSTGPGRPRGIRSSVPWQRQVGRSCWSWMTFMELDMAPEPRALSGWPNRSPLPGCLRILIRGAPLAGAAHPATEGVRPVVGCRGRGPAVQAVGCPATLSGRRLTSPGCLRMLPRRTQLTGGWAAGLVTFRVRTE